MRDSPPAPPEELDEELRKGLTSYSPDRLRAVARYAEKLADYRERGARQSKQTDETRGKVSIKEPPDEESTGESIGEKSVRKSVDEDPARDTPDGVPAKATLTIKEINGNRYYYWQWRDGDKVKSKYKGPVDQGE